MIKLHDFNTEWWGKPTGIITDPAFFSLPKEQQIEILAPYQWVEFRAEDEKHPSLQAISKAGFFQVDTQINFQIDMRKLQPTSNTDALSIHSASKIPFSIDIDSIKSFSAERFKHIPDIKRHKIDERYVLWSKKLIAKNPEWCMEIKKNGIVQGWLLSSKTDKGLNLTLGMRSLSGDTTWYYIFQKALMEYVKQGADIGWASYSVTNIPVMNVYSALSVRLTGCEHFWLWVNKGDSDET
jgi:hypothetical protein